MAAGIAGLSVFGLHAVVEGTRWQMVPTYCLLALMALVLALRSLRESPDSDVASKRGIVRKIASGLVRFGLLPFCFLLTSFIPAALPVFELPGLPSWQQVGVSDLMVSFEDRPEILTNDPDDHRELLVRVWYPAEVADGAEQEPYFTAAEARAVTEAMRASAPVPIFLNDHATLVRTNSYRDAELSPGDARFPVLVFSHGYGSYFTQNTSLMEHLASLGYVVFSIAHTYDGGVVFPDGSAPGIGDHYGEWAKRSVTSMEQTFGEMDRFVKTTDQDARREMLEDMRRQGVEDREARLGAGLSWEVWIEDRNRFFDVLDELESGARPSVFTGRLDLNRIGLFGMSFGGATAAEVCHSHPGCRASINIDGAHYIGSGSSLLDTESSKPLMMIYASNYTTASTPSAENPGNFQALNDFYYESTATRGRRDDVIRIRIDGTSHTHLTDASFMMRYLPGMTSCIPGARIAEILNRYCRAFFDHYVKETDVRSSLLNGPAPEFPEVGFQTFGQNLD